MKYMSFLLSAFLTGALLTSSCSSNPSETSTTPSTATTTADTSSDDQGKKGKKSKKQKRKEAVKAIDQLTSIGHLEEVRESSGLAIADEPDTFYTFGDDGNPPIVYKVSDTGKLLKTIRLSATNHDWESIARDDKGNYFMGDMGNNNSDRRNLAVLRFRPESPDEVGMIKFTYPDQKEFPPSKKERNFDVEASLWHQGQLYLFTKDRGASTTSKVYTLPDKPGTYEAKLLTKLSIPGQVTDANLSPNGRRLVLMARQEMFVLEGNSMTEILKATPKQISLKNTGQTEGVVFVDDDTIYISTEQGNLYKYEF
ncbi:hypothetical protein MUN82_13685 [Hymenobacter aerilatus]|uniref:SdiA-regulated family protein n=1 Tax=Hymenobacter aerilatus TaxID=2932251 RepID=A0A8T9SQC4_9BACT|nr:hypothetical protein [Hymenobacter aerilatus]UOR03995.1 hypothetical protein MUN82_13685 [Hymenobacter aerilatus]